MDKLLALDVGYVFTQPVCLDLATYETNWMSSPSKLKVLEDLIGL